MTRAVTIESSIKGVADIIYVKLFAILLPQSESRNSEQLFIGLQTQEGALTMSGSGQYLPDATEAADEAISSLDKSESALDAHDADADELCEDTASVATTTRTGRVQMRQPLMTACAPILRSKTRWRGSSWNRTRSQVSVQVRIGHTVEALVGVMFGKIIPAAKP